MTEASARAGRLLPIGGFATLDASALPRSRRERRMASLGPLLSLVWMALLVPAVVSGSSGAGLLLGIAAAAAFLLVYLMAFFEGPFAPESPSGIRAVLVVLFLLYAALTFARPDVCWYLVYVLAAVGANVDPERAVPRLLAVALAGGLFALLVGAGPGDVVAVALTAFSIGLMISALARAATTNARLSEAREELARLAVADERLRISRDMHDLLGHSLSVIALKAELAGRLVEVDPVRATHELGDVQAVARESLAEVRQLVSGYRLLALDEAVAGARTSLEAAGIALEMEARTHVGLDPSTEAVLAWTVREGATNVVRHSGARRCEIRITTTGAEAEVEVRDDGRGSAAGHHSGNGLTGLAERVARLRGRIEIGSAGERGFRLLVTVPSGDGG